MERSEKLAPFIISGLGIVSDFMTTQLWLMKGLREAHLFYSPIYAFTIFWLLLTVATFALPKRPVWRLTVVGLASISFLGAFNNIFLILGIL